MSVVAPVLDAEGGIQGAIAVVEDISAPDANERRLELASSAATENGLGVSMVSAGTVATVYANEQWNQLFGYGPEELTGRHHLGGDPPTNVYPAERANEILDALDPGPHVEHRART